MKKIIAAFMALVVGILLVSFANGVVTDVESTPASVTVNEFVSITLSDPISGLDIAFGSLNPGTNNNPDLEQGVSGNSTPAVRVTNDAISNVDVKVDVKGTAFSSVSTGATIAVGQVTYDDEGTASEGSETLRLETALATTYPGSPYFTGVAPSTSVGFFFFLDVPSGQKAATDYSSTFSFQGST